MVVQDRLSSEALIANQPGPLSITVIQAPEQQMEAPISISSVS